MFKEETGKNLRVGIHWLRSGMVLLACLWAFGGNALAAGQDDSYQDDGLSYDERQEAYDDAGHKVPYEQDGFGSMDNEDMFSDQSEDADD
mgnify:CR=1 FL=1